MTTTLEIQWLLSCYGPCLKPFTLVDGPGFASLIREVYSTDNPRNAEACRLAESLPGQFSMKHCQFTYTQP